MFTELEDSDLNYEIIETIEKVTETRKIILGILLLYGLLKPFEIKYFNTDIILPELALFFKT
ncbi:CLUMA_CG021041, isoform A [Clunio marinus]|uniref:CLUMA_CG021041, isoform A n=1 Tax=Clunio marinus TaxID=568069 RepID=A0A1J1J822_9DIPT|nr:CLUMA_CG021041, isoform A [Clunio marinus]